MVARGKDKDGNDAMFLNHLDMYQKGILQSTNLLAIFELNKDQKDYRVESCLIEACKFLGINCNNAFDSAFTVTGTVSDFGACYAI